MKFLALTTPSGAPLPVLAYANAAGHVLPADSTAGHLRSPRAVLGQVDYGAIARHLDGLEERALRTLTGLLEGWHAALAEQVSRASADGGLDALSRTLELPRRSDLLIALRALLERAWRRGSSDARGEVRGAEFAYNPSQPRDPEGTGTGGQWTSGGVPAGIQKEVGLLREELKTANGNLFLSAHVVGSWGKGDPTRIPDRRGVGTSDIDIILTAKEVKGNWEARAKARDARQEFISRVSAKLRAASTREIELRESEVIQGAGALRIFADPSFTPNSALAWLADKAFWITNVVGDKLLNDAKGVIISSMKTGKPLGQTLLDLAAVFEPYLGNEDIIRDEKQAQPYRLATIIRTNTTEAYNHGRLTEFVSADMLPFLNGVRYSAVMDERTTEVCRFLDGKVFEPGSPDLDYLVPPNHFNCRSIVVPVVVGSKVDEDEFITPEEVGRARVLADAKFLAERQTAQPCNHYQRPEAPREVEVVMDPKAQAAQLAALQGVSQGLERVVASVGRVEEVVRAQAERSLQAGEPRPVQVVLEQKDSVMEMEIERLPSVGLGGPRYHVVRKAGN